MPVREHSSYMVEFENFEARIGTIRWNVYLHVTDYFSKSYSFHC